MPKPNKKNNRNDSKQRPVSEHESSLTTKVAKKQLVINSREDNEIESKKQCLIVCEGETEAAYFMALQKVIDLRFNCTVLPQKDKDNAHKGDIKNLLRTAIEESKKVPVPYDAIWIVFDNDEQNSYKLDNESFIRFENANINSSLIDRLKAAQIAEMDVRQEDIDKNENKRVRYFLNEADYLNFLDTEIIVTQVGLKRQIIQETSKSNLLFEVFDDGNFEIKWRKANINIAFSSISFEHWLLLHFEQNQTAFYNSREIIRYFDTKKYFNEKFKKGWYLYEKREESTIKDFFQEVGNAILNNIWLNNQVQSQINAGKQFYEINPFSDVFRLTNLLINNQLSCFYVQNTKINFQVFQDLTIVKSDNVITISFISKSKKPILVREVLSQAKLYDFNKNEISLTSITNITDIIRTDESKAIELTVNSTIFPIVLKLQNFDKTSVLFCLISS